MSRWLSHEDGLITLCPECSKKFIGDDDGDKIAYFCTECGGLEWDVPSNEAGFRYTITEDGNIVFKGIVDYDIWKYDAWCPRCEEEMIGFKPTKEIIGKLLSLKPEERIKHFKEIVGDNIIEDYEDEDEEDEYEDDDDDLEDDEDEE